MNKINQIEGLTDVQKVEIKDILQQEMANHNLARNMSRKSSQRSLDSDNEEIKKEYRDTILGEEIKIKGIKSLNDEQSNKSNQSARHIKTPMGSNKINQDSAKPSHCASQNQNKMGTNLCENMDHLRR